MPQSPAFVDLVKQWCGVAVVGLVIVGATGCGLLSESPEDAIGRFAHGLAERNPAAAAAQTSDPDRALRTITSMFDGMGGNARLTVRPKIIDDKRVTATLDQQWDLGHGRSVEYESTVKLRQHDSAWHVEWAPTVLHPSLRAGQTFSYSDDKALRTPVVDRHGAVLMRWQTVHLVNLAPEQSESADEVARVLRPVDRSITAESIRQQLSSSPSQRTIIRLRDQDYARVGGALRSIHGVTVSEQGALLTASRSLRSPALAGMEQVWRDRLDETAGWSVALVDSAGAPTDILEQHAPAPTAAIQTNLDRDIQASAQSAVDGETRPTMIVAISPSSGGIAAVAQNRAADRSGSVALTGLYPPGSTFKTITTAAALQAGVVTPDTRLACPGTATIEGRTIPNENEFDLGTVSLTSAFAHSCNTTMGALANRLPGNALPTTAHAFGLGVDFVVPGITTVTGRVPDATSPALRVENGIGQGTVTVSPFGMAVVEASLAASRTVTPSLLTGARTTGDSPAGDIPQAITSALRMMMRHTVTDGTARSLRSIPGLGGKTGTAEYGDNTHPHGWFAGVAGDLAFATLVVGGGDSSEALAVTGRFLEPLRD